MAGSARASDDGGMVEGFAVIFFMLIVTVVAAAAVIVGLALVRRPAEAWQEHLKEQNAQFAAEDAADPEDAVQARSTSLNELLESNAVVKNGYFDADRLPGLDRIEVVADRIEAMQEARRASKEAGPEGAVEG